MIGRFLNKGSKNIQNSNAPNGSFGIVKSSTTVVGDLAAFQNFSAPNGQYGTWTTQRVFFGSAPTAPASALWQSYGSLSSVAPSALSDQRSWNLYRVVYRAVQFRTGEEEPEPVEWEPCQRRPKFQITLTQSNLELEVGNTAPRLLVPSCALAIRQQMRILPCQKWQQNLSAAGGRK